MSFFMERELLVSFHFYHYTPIAHGYILHGMYSNQSGLRIVFGVVGSLIMGIHDMIRGFVGNGKYRW